MPHRRCGGNCLECAAFLFLLMTIMIPVQPLLRLTPIAATVACLIFPSAHAEQANTTQPQVAANVMSPLPAVIVSGTREAPSLTQSNLQAAQQQVAHTAGGAAVVDLDTVREGRVSTLADALGYAPGVFVQSRFGAEEARISVRGSGLQRTFHGRGLLVLQDGVPINLADGSFDMQAIEPLAARYIEVYRGANALPFGSATLGGAINYVSPTGYDSSPFMARGEFGSYGYRRFNVMSGGVAQTRYGLLDGNLSVSTFDQNGFRRHAEQSAQRVVGNAGWRVSDNLETRFYFAYANSNSQLPGNLTKAQLQDDPRQGNAATIAGDQQRDLDVTRIANKTTFRVNAETDVVLSGFYASKNLFHPIFQVLDQDNQDFGLGLKLQNRTALLGHGNRLTVGVSPSYDRTDEDRWVNVGGTRGARTDKSRQKSSTFNAWLEDQFDVTERLTVVAGVQYTRSTRKLDDLFIAPGTADASYSFDYSAWSPKIGVIYALTPKVQVFGNISKSYEPPSLSEIYGGQVPKANAAQKAVTYELGSRGELAETPAYRVSWDVSIYHARLRDELLAVLEPGETTATTQNVGKTLHQGVELGVSATVGGHWDLRMALLLNRFRFDDHPIYGDNVLPGVPKIFLRQEALYRFTGGWLAGAYVGANVEWSPARMAVDMRNSFYADGYTVFGLKMGQQLNRNWSWFLEGRNLADRHYAATTGVATDLKGKDAAQFLPGDGRTVYAGLQYRY